MASTKMPVGPDTLVTVKIAIGGSLNRKFKIPLKDLGANVLPEKLRLLLEIPATQEVVFERYSDSAGAFIILDPENPHVYKTLFRAAKAKLKLRLRATLKLDPSAQAPQAPLIANGSVGTAPTIMQQSSMSVPALHPQGLCSGTTLNDAGSIRRMTSRNTLTSRAVGSLVEEGEAPVPRAFSAARENFFAELASLSRARELALRMKEPPTPAPYPWSVYCNACDKPTANEHFHCSVCDDGDYDLCTRCVASGAHCPGEGHWLIKRFVKNGIVISSTTDKLGPKIKPEAMKEMPGAFTEEKKAEHQEGEQSTRTCNSCVKVFPECEFVTCVVCDDYDLCMPCHVDNKHGHHPGHAFEPATPDTYISAHAKFLCAPGRNARHAAICDGCEKYIYGIRHKCLTCPDWDYCSECVKKAKHNHPFHRFVQIYEPLPEPHTVTVRHYGIYCDGPLCQKPGKQTYIQGVRYKCAVCHDTDFCQNCEASPTNRHNRTHPLIKFKTPVRNVSVTTMGEDKHGATMGTMGDQLAIRSAATETVPAPRSSNAATQVQTIVDLKPSEETAHKPVEEKTETKDLLAESFLEKIKAEYLLTTPIEEEVKAEVQVKAESSETPQSKFVDAVSTSELNAHYVRDTITDGSKMLPNQRFIQVWTMLNPGPHAWPAGCSVRYVGGDNMLNVDNNYPSSATDLAEATESNVIGRTVEVGEEINFRVLMKAPKREGVSISYWRLKAADGTPFGHRLWCHIDVINHMVMGYSAPMQQTPLSAPSPSESSKSQVHDSDPYAAVVRLHREARLRIEANRLALLQHLKDVCLPDVPKEYDEAVEEATDAPVENQEAEQCDEEVKQQEGSQMVFPTLEKESPVSSTIHEAVDGSGPSRAEFESALASPATAKEGEFFEDAESVDLVECSMSEEEGFMTDEEYDILDARDREEEERIVRGRT